MTGTATSQRHAVVMASDANYAPYALCLADQLHRRDGVAAYDIVLVSQDRIALPDGLRIPNLHLVRLDRDNPFENGPHVSRHGAATYLRLLVPELLSGRYDRVVYLDSDIVVQGPVAPLFDADMKGRAVAAVRDNLQWRTPTRHTPEHRQRGLPQAPYMNAGVLLIDVAAFNAAGLLARAEALMTEAPEVLTRHDQSILNILLHRNWTELSPVWNWQYTWSSRFFADLAEPRLLHFIGPRKPWKDSAAQLPARFRRTYAEFVTRYYPDRAADLAPVDGMALGWPARPAGTFLKHAVSARAMHRYLSRFPGPLTTRAT